MKYFYLVIAFLMAIMIQEKNFLIQAMEEVEGEIEESMEARVFLYKVKIFVSKSIFFSHFD